MSKREAAGRHLDMITLKGKRFVLVPQEEYELMVAGAPAMPVADSEGMREAVGFAVASIARDVVKMRVAAGLSQKELAALAGIRVEVLNRTERGVTVPSTRTLAKIEAALARAKGRQKPRKRATA